MTLVGIPSEEQDAVWQLVAVVLHLGNLLFKEGADQDSSDISEPAVGHLEAAARLLGTQPVILLKSLTTRTRQTVDGTACPLDLAVVIASLQTCKHHPPVYQSYPDHHPLPLEHSSSSSLLGSDDLIYPVDSSIPSFLIDPSTQYPLTPSLAHVHLEQVQG